MIDRLHVPPDTFQVCKHMSDRHRLIIDRAPSDYSIIDRAPAADQELLRSPTGLSIFFSDTSPMLLRCFDIVEILRCPDIVRWPEEFFIKCDRGITRRISVRKNRTCTSGLLTVLFFIHTLRMFNL